MAVVTKAWGKISSEKSPYTYTFSLGSSKENGAVHHYGSVSLEGPVPHGIENATFLREAIGRTATRGIVDNLDDIYQELDPALHSPIY